MSKSTKRNCPLCGKYTNGLVRHLYDHHWEEVDIVRRNGGDPKVTPGSRIADDWRDQTEAERRAHLILLAARNL